MKNQPFNKTVVSELTVKLADLMSKSVIMKSSVASPIPLTDVFNSGDVVLTPEKPILITGIKSCLIVSSFQNFEIVFSGERESVVLPCNGLFVHHGSAHSVLIRAPHGVEAVRLQYIWS